MPGSRETYRYTDRYTILDDLKKEMPLVFAALLLARSRVTRQVCEAAASMIAVDYLSHFIPIGSKSNVGFLLMRLSPLRPLRPAVVKSPRVTANEDYFYTGGTFPGGGGGNARSDSAHFLLGKHTVFIP